MKINNRYVVYKKDISFCDCFVDALVYDLEKNEIFSLNFKLSFLGYSLQEKKSMSFNVVKKYLEDKFTTFYERMQFIQQYNIWKIED